jgi:hypothetical protein
LRGGRQLDIASVGGICGEPQPGEDQHRERARDDRAGDRGGLQPSGAGLADGGQPDSRAMRITSIRLRAFSLLPPVSRRRLTHL